MLAAARTGPDLIDRCVAGDRRAWSELHRLYRPQALAFLRRLGVGARDAEDACQEIFLQVFRYLDRFERRAELSTWLYKLCISQAERLRRRAALLGPLHWLRRRLLQPWSLPEWSETRAHELVEAALGVLTPRQRQVFVLFELEGLKTGEIAQLLGSPSASVRRQLHEARERFERYIREQPVRNRGTSP